MQNGQEFKEFKGSKQKLSKSPRNNEAMGNVQPQTEWLCSLLIVINEYYMIN